MSQLQYNKETLLFKIGLSGLYWDKKPQYSIKINNVEMVNSVIDAEPNEIIFESFSFDLVEDKNFNLDICLLNKTDSDTIQDEHQNIVKDMLLNIESIEIDGIELEFLKWSESTFFPLDNNRPVLKNCVNLGWNGYYRLQLYSPFYLWLLEKP